MIPQAPRSLTRAGDAQAHTSMVCGNASPPRWRGLTIPIIEGGPGPMRVISEAVAAKPKAERQAEELPPREGQHDEGSEDGLPVR